MSAHSAHAKTGSKPSRAGRRKDRHGGRRRSIGMGWRTVGRILLLAATIWFGYTMVDMLVAQVNTTIMLDALIVLGAAFHCAKGLRDDRMRANARRRMRANPDGFLRFHAKAMDWLYDPVTGVWEQTPAETDQD